MRSDIPCYNFRRQLFLKLSPNNDIFLVMATSRSQWNRILKLIEQWPVDESKTGRDLGEYFRNHLKKALEESKIEDQKFWDRQYLSLQRLLNNEHSKRYPRSLSSSATGLNAEQCNIALSNQFLEELQKEEQSVWKKFLSTTPKNEKYSTDVKECASSPHIPVMVRQMLDHLKPESGQTIIDMTFGAGGHTKKILEHAPNIKIIALDRDPIAHNYAIELVKKYPNQIVPLLGRFSELPQLLKELNIKQNSIDGVLFDFGCSSMQFDTAERGFSLSKQGPLDMRMDGDRFPNDPTAADVLRKADEDDLFKIIKYYGEEKQAKKIARAIIESRYLFKQLATTENLADLVQSVYGEDQFRTDKLKRHSHVATKTFQALRIFVNNELNEINYGLILAQHYLKIGGRIVTITFHSLEDTIVKRHLRGNIIENSPNPLPLKYSSHSLNIDKKFVNNVMETSWLELNKHVLVPDSEEIESNPRSRSAKFRAAVKVK